MELANQNLNANTNKILQIVIKVVEHHIDHGHTMWMDYFHNCIELA
jgi:hypothetical protein